MFIFRRIHGVNSKHRIATFGLATSTSSLRKHLFSEHIEEWSKACDELKIEITAAVALEAIRIFRNQPPVTLLESERPQYSKEVFVDAIVDFIVGDDQVSILFYFIIKIFN